MDDLENSESQDLDVASVETEQETVSGDEPKTSLEALERAVQAEGEVKPEVKAIEEKKPESPEDLYKMPEGLQPKSQERFTKLVESNQQKDAEISQMREGSQWIAQNFTQDEQGIQDLIGFAEYRNALKSGNFQAAGQLLQAQIQQFTLLTGQPLQANPLQGFDDLQQRVESFELDEADALEIARFRKQQAMAQSQQQQQMQEQHQQAQYKQVIDDSVNKVTQMVEQWKKTDIDYAAKEKIIAEKLPSMMKNFHPSQIPYQVQMLYEALSSVAPTRQQSVTPLRGNGISAGKAAPKSSLEAMGAVLGYDV